MPSPALSTVTVDAAAYTVTIADTPAQVRAAQRLRHDVFGGELGARLHSPEPGLDIDEFDAIADHLIVTETGSGEVVGTYRLIPPGRGGRLYAQSEFDLSALAPIRSQLVEAGRSCVHPDHRTGAVINLLWSALARYVLLSGHEYLAGCASVPLDDGGHAATSAWLLGTAKHVSPADLRVHPHRPWQPAGPLAGTPSYADLPPLLRGYLRLGAWMCGAPAHDPEFGVADFYVLLPMANVSDRYRRYFLGEER
ncbi:GNAT family N-acetyltransferase [Streptomyces sp. YC504]|uniref:GNAT family N-acetyltransferase n=1 Tax=Streptomyces mesophilus TaxID=1775132 RepID=A0A6G4XBK5_9ACTN|nr:GNAT family N-acyltransferase [Streptomyces mesophilus]NGO74542.1 GNAT family N-acetyltransferase [Streptomyces mesophilus]